MHPSDAKRIIFTLALALACLVLSSPLFALKGDRDQPIEIEADSVDINEGAGTAVYHGQVILTQGSMKMHADRVTVYQRPNEPNKVVAEGTPVKLRQQPDNQQKLIKAEAKKAEYLVDSEELFLLGDAHLQQGKDSFRSQRIVYDRVKARIKAGKAVKRAGGESQSGRVKITIEPGRFKK